MFIEAHRRYYAFDLAPKFWQALVEHACNGQVESIDRVGASLDPDSERNTHHMAILDGDVPSGVNR